MAQRYDRATILDHQDSADGYLTVRASIARPGVFPYRRADGALQYEAKLPADILSDEVVSSSKAKPVTDSHPPEPVTAANWNKYARGFSLTDAVVEGERVAVTLTVTDAALIEKVRSGKQREISIGFNTDLVHEPGEYMGQRYDSKQTNIAINHIAIVSKGRAGPEVAIRGDSAYEIDDENKGGHTMAKYTIDGAEFEVPSEVKSFLDAQAARLDAANVRITEVDKLQGRFDAQAAELEGVKKELETAKANALTNDQMDAAVTARVGLLTTARLFLGDAFDFSGKSDREIKVESIKKVDPTFTADGKSDDYVSAYFDSTKARAQSEGHRSVGTQSLFTGDVAGHAAKVAEMKAARLNMKKDGEK